MDGCSSLHAGYGCRDRKMEGRERRKGKQKERNKKGKEKTRIKWMKEKKQIKIKRKTIKTTLEVGAERIGW